MDISELLAFSVKNSASDLHLSAGQPPMIRVDGEIRRINVPPMDHKGVHSLIYDIMNDKFLTWPAFVLMRLTINVGQVRYSGPFPVPF